MKGLEAPHELQINTVRHKTAITNADSPNQRATTVKNQHSTEISAFAKKQKEQSEDTQNIPGNKNSGANKSIPNNRTNNNNNNDYKNSNGAGRKPKTAYRPCETSPETNHPKKKCYYWANAAKKPPPRHRKPERQNQVKKSQSKLFERNCLGGSPKFKLKMPRLLSVAAIDRPQTTKLPTVPEVVWEQPQETHLIDIQKNSTTDFQRKNDVESQTSPKTENSPQVSGSDTEPLLGNQNRSTPVHCPNDSKKQKSEMRTKIEVENQQNEIDMTAKDSGDDNFFAPKIITSEIEERLVRDDVTKEL